MSSVFIFLLCPHHSILASSPSFFFFFFKSLKSINSSKYFALIENVRKVPHLFRGENESMSNEQIILSNDYFFLDCCRQSAGSFEINISLSWFLWQEDTKSRYSNRKLQERKKPNDFETKKSSFFQSLFIHNVAHFRVVMNSNQCAEQMFWLVLSKQWMRGPRSTKIIMDTMEWVAWTIEDLKKLNTTRNSQNSHGLSYGLTALALGAKFFPVAHIFLPKKKQQLLIKHNCMLLVVGCCRL